MKPPTPHGLSFSFVDSFVIKPGGKDIQTSKFLSPDLPFFADHFPGRPLMPGVLLIECTAQAAGVLWAENLVGIIRPIFRLVQVLNFKISREVLPGQTVQTHATMEREFGGLAQFFCRMEESGDLAAVGRIVLALHSEGGEPGKEDRNFSRSTFPRPVKGSDLS